MPKLIITKAVVFEDGGALPLARILGSDGSALQQADLTGVDYSIFEKTSGTQIVGVTSLTVSDVIFDSLQTDSRWTVDTTGYNFRHQIADDTMVSPGTVYRVEYRFDPTAGEDFFAVWELRTETIIRS